MKKMLMLIVLFLMVTGISTAGDILKVDFNSTNQDGGPHNQEGWEAYDAGHEVPADFVTVDFGGITVTPAWTNTTDNRVQQMIDRGSGNDDNWDNSNEDLDLVTDFLGIDTRTGNGGNGNWDGIDGTPTYMTLTIGGLGAGDYAWTSFHHDTENVFGDFAIWISVDSGATFTQLADGIMTDSSPGGNPDSGATEIGPDAYTLSSTYRTVISSDGTNDVVLRFAPYAANAVHQQIWGINAFTLGFPTTAHAPTPSGAELVDIDVDLGWKTALDEETGVMRTDVVNHILYLSAPNDPNASESAPITIAADGSGFGSYDPGVLQYSAVYTWRVDEELDDSSIITGPDWSFEVIPSDFAPTVTIAGDADEAITWIGNLPETDLAATVDDNGEGDLADIIWEIIGGPGVPDATDMQMLDRSGDLGNLTGDPNLIRDWIGTDGRGAGTDTLVLTLSGVPTGTYTWTSYHHDAQNQTGLFDVTITDGAGVTTTTDLDITAATETPMTFSTTIESNGSDITLAFVVTTTTGSNEFFLMNGFELTGTGDPLMIDFTQDTTTFVMPGYEGYFAAHEVPETFTPQAYAALGSTVTVSPSWGYIAATITDTTTDMLAPTATFDVTDTPNETTGTYTIELTAIDAGGQSDSDTMLIRLGADSCEAAKLTPDFELNYFDIDEDCDVDMFDFAAFADQWLDDLNLLETLYL